MLYLHDLLVENVLISIVNFDLLQKILVFLLSDPQSFLYILVVDLYYQSVAMFQLVNLVLHNFPQLLLIVTVLTDSVEIALSGYFARGRVYEMVHLFLTRVYIDKFLECRIGSVVIHAVRRFLLNRCYNNIMKE